MGLSAVLKTTETSLWLLDEEARRVARGMASFRNERVDRLCGPSTPLPGPITSREPRRPSQNIGNAGFSPFYYYPFLFVSAFPSVAVEDLRTLALANRILLEAILLSDKKIDETRPWTPADFYLVDSYFHRALEMLIPLFPLEHVFWQKTQGWFLQHGRAIVKEQLRHRHRLCPYTQEEFFEVSTGKVALIKTNLLAMALLSDTSEVLAPLVESQDRFLAGFQCFDDLKDWKEDLRHGNFTFLLTRVLFAGGLDAHVLRGDPVPREEAGQVLYHRGIAEEQLQLAEHYFLQALDSVQNIHVPDWAATVTGFLRHCQTMRHDLAEIRRRTTSKTRPKTVATRLAEALDFIVRSAPTCGGFPLSQSDYPYMNPSTPVASSRFVTSLLHRALAPFLDMDSRLPALLPRVSEWLTLPRKVPSNPSLPMAVEESFLPFSTDRGALLEFDQGLDGTLPLRPHGLFWANLLFTASRENVRLPKLKSLVETSIHQADYSRWTQSPSPESVNPASDRAACHPLLALLLFCHASGPGLPRAPLHDYLLRRNRKTGTWNNPTETALTLLCLLSTGYPGPELSPAVEKLIRSQEPDGSWPPNSLYEQANLFYGSRELTTAWCLLALFLYHMGPSLPATQEDPLERSRQPAPSPTIFLHTGLPRRLKGFTRSALEALRPVLDPPWPHKLYVGHWPSMPPHFLLNTNQLLVIGVNVLPHRQGRTLSTGQRPLRVEIWMAMMLAHRCLRNGPLRDRLERIFVGGLALSSCGRVWPRHAPWERLGMRRLDWAWCREHEAFLWEELRRFLLHPSPKQPLFRWLLPDPSPGSPDSLIPKGASLFLGEGLFDNPFDDQEPCEQVNGLLGKSLPDILRTFRKKVGLDSDENFFA
jgi:hypothetical protein